MTRCRSGSSGLRRDRRVRGAAGHHQQQLTSRPRPVRHASTGRGRFGPALLFSPCDIECSSESVTYTPPPARGAASHAFGAACSAAGAAWCLTASVAGAQTPEPSHEADGLVHASLALEAQEIDVAFPPELRAGHHAYRWLLSATVGSRVKVGTLDAHRALRLGTLEPDIEAIEAEIAAIRRRETGGSRSRRIGGTRRRRGGIR